MQFVISVTEKPSLESIEAISFASFTGFFNGKPGIVAMYTSAKIKDMHNEDDQAQCIAYSKDNGRTFEKYKGNPVIKNQGIVDFRDPWVNNPFIEKGKFERSLDKKFEYLVVKHADIVIANTELLGERMKERYKSMAPKIITLPNGYDARDFKDMSSVQLAGESGHLHPDR